MGGKSVQGLGNGLIGQLGHLGEGLALDHLRSHGAGGDGAATAEGLKLHILDHVVLDLQIHLHNVPAAGVALGAHAVGVGDLPDAN